MIERLRARDEWKFAGVLSQADRALAIVWWTLLVVRGLLPALFAVAMGGLVGAVQRGGDLAAPLGLVGVVFVLLQVLSPIHHAVGANLGSRTAAWLYDRLATACVRPPGMGHLENPKLTNDLTVARDFDLGISGPPLFISMDFIAGGLVEMLGGLASAVVLAGFAWWAPFLLAGGWLATHWLLRESAVWRDRNTDEVREAQRHADYAYRLAVDPPAAKELRLFGLADWILERFRSRRRRLFELRWQATRLRERPVIWSLLLVLAANVVVFWSLGAATTSGQLALDRLVTFASAAVSTSMIAFGGLSWALDGAAAPAAAVLRLQDAMDPAGALVRGDRPAAGMPAREIRFRHVTFAYPTSGEPVLAGFDLAIPAGSSLAIVGQNGAENDHREAPLPAVRSPGRRHRGGRRRPPHLRRGRLALARDRCISGLHALRAAAARQRGSRRRSRRRDRPRARRSRRHGPGRSRHGARARLSRRHGPVRRPVAAHRAGAGAVRRAARRRSGAARRADGPARRPRRGRDLRPHPRRHASHHDHPDLAPLLDGAPRRSHLRAGARHGGGARHARRADGGGRPLPDDVRAAGVALRRRRRGRSRSGCPRLTTCRRPCPPCGARSSAATKPRRCS